MPPDDERTAEWWRETYKREMGWAMGDIEALRAENDRLRRALSHDREVCGWEDNLCWKCRALTPDPKSQEENNDVV